MDKKKKKSVAKKDNKSTAKKPEKKALERVSLLTEEDLGRFRAGAAATCPAKEAEC